MTPRELLGGCPDVEELVRLALTRFKALGWACGRVGGHHPLGVSPRFRRVSPELALAGAPEIGAAPLRAWAAPVLCSDAAAFTPARSAAGVPGVLEQVAAGRGLV